METVAPNKIKMVKPIGNFLSMFMRKPKQINEKIKLDEVKELLVYDPGLIGDTIMTIPLLQIIRSNFKNANVTYVCGSCGETVLKDTKLVDNFVICNGLKSFMTVGNMIKEFPHFKSVLKDINKKQYDVAIEPRGDVRFIFFMHYINAKRKVSFDYTGGEDLLTDSIKLPDNYKELHTVEDKIYLLEQIGCKIKEGDKYPKLDITDEMKKRKQDFIHKYNLENSRILGIHPGAREEIRRYPYFDKVLEHVYENNKNIAFVIYEGVDEAEHVKRVKDMADKLGAKSIVLKSSLEEYLKNITICDYMLCNDSSAGHIANAYKIPTTVMYGPVNFEGIRPYDNVNAKLECVSLKMECKPCYASQTCPNKNYKCFNDIQIENVANKILENIL